MDLFNVPGSALSAAVWASTSVVNGLISAGLCRSRIKYCPECLAASIDDIIEMVYFLGHKSNVSDILSALVSGIYALWHL